MKLENIFIISGPSGAGEDSIIKELKKTLQINKIITTTTREKREGEKEGVDYHYVSKSEFKNKIKKDQMAEWALEYNDNYYGVTKKELKRVNDLKGIGIWKIEYKGVMTAKKKFPGIVAIMIMTESLDELERRIKERSEVTGEYIIERMEYTKEWLRHRNIYDYEVINRRGKLDEAAEEIKNIIKSYQKKGE